MQHVATCTQFTHHFLRVCPKMGVCNQFHRVKMAMIHLKLTRPANGAIIPHVRTHALIYTPYLAEWAHLHGSGMSHATTGCPGRGRQRKCWKDNIKAQTSLPMPELLTMASCKKDWKRISAESPLMPPPPLRRTTQSVKGLN